MRKTPIKIFASQVFVVVSGLWLCKSDMMPNVIQYPPYEQNDVAPNVFPTIISLYLSIIAPRGKGS